MSYDTKLHSRDTTAASNASSGTVRTETGPRYRDEIFSRRIPAGRRTYYFDVKTTRSGEDFFLVVTESKRVGEHRYEKHKIFLYKEDFAKFVRGLHEAVEHIKAECLPDYDFIGYPQITFPDSTESGD